MAEPPPKNPKDNGNQTTDHLSLNIGDIVEIQTNKYTGKKGKVTHIDMDKYGVRVKLDLDGSGNYFKVAEYRRPHVSFKGYDRLDLTKLKVKSSDARAAAKDSKTIGYLRISTPSRDTTKLRYDMPDDRPLQATTHRD